MNLRRILFCLSLTLLSACTPIIIFPQMKPGNFYLGKDPVFAIGKVNVTHELDLKQGDRGEKWASRVAGKLLGVSEDAPDLPSDLEANMISAIESNRFGSYSTEHPGYTVNLDGKFTCRDRAEHKPEQEVKDGKTVYEDSYVAERTCGLEIDYRVLPVSGTGFAAKGRYDRIRRDSKKAASQDDAVDKLSDWFDMYQAMSKEAATEIGKELMPHFEMVQRELKQGSSQAVKDSVKLAGTDLQAAGRLWFDFSSRVDSLSPKDKIAVYHNLGVYFESRDELDSAANAFASCAVAGGDKACTDGLNRIRERSAELKRLKEAGR